MESQPHLIHKYKACLPSHLRSGWPHWSDNPKPTAHIADENDVIGWTDRNAPHDWNVARKERRSSVSPGWQKLPDHVGIGRRCLIKWSEVQRDNAVCIPGSIGAVADDFIVVYRPEAGRCLELMHTGQFIKA